MAAISTALAIGGLALGAGSMAYGISERMSAQGDMEAANAQRIQGYQQMAGVARDQNTLAKDQSASSYYYAGLNFNLEQQAAEQSRQASIQSQAINRNIVQSELAVQNQRRQAMEIDARRKQTEVIRNQQRARALALSSATAQGASRGSGLQGGYAQISGQSGVNMLGIQQNLQIGRNIYDLTNQISQSKIQASDLETLFANQRADLQTQKAQMVYDYAKANAEFQTRGADLQTRASMAQGTLNLAQGQMESAQSNANYANTFIGMAPTLFNMGVTASNVFATNSTTSSSTGGWGYMNNPAYSNTGAWY